MNTADTVRAQSRKDPAQLEHEIDQQRDHIGELIHALENRLSPGDLFERVLGNGHGREFAGNLARTVKDNPMPTLLTVAGLTWLYAGSHDGAHDGAADPNASDKPGVGERVGQAREQVSGKMHSAKQRVGESAHHAMDSARSRARRSKQGFEHMLDDNPMAIGAMAIAAGALLGAMLPPTRKEDELLGPVRDRSRPRRHNRSGRHAWRHRQTGREVTAGEHDHDTAGVRSTSTASTTSTSPSAQPGL